MLLEVGTLYGLLDPLMNLNSQMPMHSLNKILMALTYGERRHCIKIMMKQPFFLSCSMMFLILSIYVIFFPIEIMKFQD